MQKDYICVYDMSTSEEELLANWHEDGYKDYKTLSDNHGLCVLEPSVCEITEELNGTYELYMEHPFDELGRWKALAEHNIIKANGQLFRIIKKRTKLNQSGEKVRAVNAMHIFYDWNTKLIQHAKTDGGGHAAYWFIRMIFDNIFWDDPNNEYPFYGFDWSTDFGDEVRWAEFNNTSVTAAIMGSGSSFVNVYGAELHRDNFSFSLNRRKEGANDNAFSIRYGIDMVEVEETVDYTNFCSKLVASDNYGNTIVKAWNKTYSLPHNFVKGVQFNYSDNNFSRFSSDVDAYFSKVYLPATSYKVRYADFSNSPMYTEFDTLKRCNVGDEGEIFCEELGINTKQKVVKKVIDVLKNETVSTELSNLSASIVRQNLFTNIIAPVAKSSTDGYFELMSR